MRVRLAKNSGFCFGVKRAINIAREAGKKSSEKIYTIGPIIHNPQVVAQLEDLNVYSTKDLEIIKDKSAIIRSHGLSKEKLEFLKDNGANLIDATCPNVYDLQRHGNNLSKEGYFVVILGDKNHPEVKAVCSYIEGNHLVVIDAEEIPNKRFKKVALLSQTTQTYNKFESIVAKLLKQSYELRIVNTICYATTVRQNSTRELAKNSDLMIVVGGMMSSNTKMLAKISSEYCETYHIEVADEIDESWIESKKSIGITAGASTPDNLIINVYNRIININGDLKRAELISDIPVFKEEPNEL